MAASYLQRADGRSPSDWVPESSRRARGFPVWAALRALGRNGVAELIERCCDHASTFASVLGAQPGVEILNEVVLNQVLVRFDDDDDATREVVRRVQAEGTCWLGGTDWQGRAAMRISVSSFRTTAEDVERSAEAILERVQEPPAGTDTREVGSLRLIVAAAVALLVCVAAPASEAYVVKGKPWPGGTIRYYNAAADQAWPVARAVYVWNHSGARIRFVPSSRASAQLVIKHFSHNRCVGHARATVGHVRQATVELPRIDESSQLCNSYSSAHAVAHELGHVLGLGHEERGCALMNGRGTWSGAQHCRQEAVWTWRCGLLEPDDINGVVALYGGRTSSTSRGSCSAYAPIRAPLSLSAERQSRRDRRAPVRTPRPAADASVSRGPDPV